MDNSHIFWVSQGCRFLLLPQLQWLPLSRGHLTTRRVLDMDQQEASASRCVHTRAWAHTRTLPTHSPLPGNGREYWEKKRGSQGRASLSLPEISEEQQGPPAAQGHGPNGISLLPTLPSVPDRPLLGKNGTGPLRSCLVHLPPTNRMQPIRIRAWPDPCPTMPTADSWTQVNAQPLPNLWATSAFN